MKCWIYRGRRQPEAYLFLPRPDDFEAVPDELLERFGGPVLVIGLELSSRRKLAREDVEQVMHNLLDNALKYGGEEKRIEVGVERSGGLVLIRVRDWGVGISGEDQVRIFNRFYRTDPSRQRDREGSGLGV